MNKRLISLLMVFCMVVLMLGACGNKEGGTEADAQGTQDGTDKGSESVSQFNMKTLKVTVDGNLINFPEGLSANENFIIDGLRKKTGMDIQWTILPLDGNIEKLNSMMSAGNAGDIVSMRDSSLIGRYAKEKLIIPIDDYLKNTKYLNDEATPDAIKVLTTIKGQRYAVSTVNGLPGTTATVIRKDWLAKLGLQQPKDKDEFYDMLKKFKENDLNGKGAGDVVPMVVYGSASGIQAQSFMMLRGLFDIPNDFQLKDGKVVYTLVEPEGKAYLEYVRKLYEEGLIPKDYAALKDQAAQDILMGNRGAVMTDWPWGQKTNMPAIKEKYGGELVFMDHPKSISGITAQCQTQTPLAMSVMVTKFCEDPQTAINFLDTLFQEDVVTLTNYGIEGETFNYVDSKPVFTEEVTSGKRDLNWNVYYANHLLQPPEIWHYKDATLQGWGEYYYATERNVGVIYPADVMMPPQPDLISARLDLDTSIVKFYDDVVTGRKSIDEFDSFRKTWLSSGGQEVLDGYTKVYEELGSPKFAHPQANIDRPNFTGVHLFNGKK